jgi:hypothetical protein
MKDPQQHDPHDSLSKAYEKMFERAINKFHSVEEKSAHLLHQLIDEARDKAIGLKEVSEEEAEKLTVYLKRDLNDAAMFLSKTGNEIEDWLGFETQLLESSFLNQLLKVADKTTLELLKMKQNAEILYSYHTGEITGPSTLICDPCGERLHFRTAGKIPPCPKCHATRFHRKLGRR